MKKCLSLLLACAPSFGFADTFYAAFPATSAVIHPQGALVDHTAVLALPAGQHTVILPVQGGEFDAGFSKFSISGAALQSVSIADEIAVDPLEFLTPSQIAALEAVEQAKAKLVAAQLRLETARADIAGLRDQATFLKAIRPSTQTPQSFDDLQSIANYLPTALADIGKAIAQQEADLAPLGADVEAAETELARAELIARQQSATPQDQDYVSLQLDVASDQSVAITSQLFNQDMSWNISYEMILDEDASNLTINRAAAIESFASAAWNNVDVVLTSSSLLRATGPTRAGRDVVRLIKPQSKSVSRDTFANGAMSEPMMVAEVASFASLSGDFDGIALDFSLPNPVSIPAGATAQQVIELESLSLPVEISRYAMPRRDETGFVRVDFTNTTGEPLLPGDVLLKRGKNLMGSGQIQAITAGADATLYFGPDDSLPLTMRFLSEMRGDRGFITKSNTRQEQVAFSVQNLSDTTRDVTVVYALPITVDEDLGVDVTASIAPDRRDVEDVQGRAEWDMTLAAGETRTVTLDFEITWPDGAQVHWQP